MTNPDTLMENIPLRQMGEEELSQATITVAWLNRDTPEDIPDMLDALGLVEHARKMRRMA